MCHRPVAKHCTVAGGSRAVTHILNIQVTPDTIASSYVCTYMHHSCFVVVVSCIAYRQRHTLAHTPLQEPDLKLPGVLSLWIHAQGNVADYMADAVLMSTPHSYT